MGQENTYVINIGDIKTRALIDTGSTISKVCEHFVKLLFPKPIVHDLEEIDLQMKVADGRTLPYTGYIELVENGFWNNTKASINALVVSHNDNISFSYFANEKHTQNFM